MVPLPSIYSIWWYPSICQSSLYPFSRPIPPPWNFYQLILSYWELSTFEYHFGCSLIFLQWSKQFCYLFVVNFCLCGGLQIEIWVIGNIRSQWDYLGILTTESTVSFPYSGWLSEFSASPSPRNPISLNCFPTFKYLYTFPNSLYLYKLSLHLYKLPQSQFAFIINS